MYIQLFCTNEQRITTHESTVDGNGEYLFTCGCGRFVKFPASFGLDELNAALANHQAANMGQVSIQPQLDVLNKIADTTAESQSNDTDNVPA